MFYPFAMSKSTSVTSLFDEGQRVNGGSCIPYIKFDYLRPFLRIRSSYSIKYVHSCIDWQNLHHWRNA